MKSLSLHGPLAYYERKNAENEARIQHLEGEVSLWRGIATEAREALAREQQLVQELRESQIPALKNEQGVLAELVAELQAKLVAMEQEKASMHEGAAAAAALADEQIQRLRADNEVLKVELSKAVLLRQTTSSKVEEARRKLGLNTQEAEFFIKDLDETKAANKALRAEVAALSSDKAHLQQQCDSRSSHAMTLISENKRLLEQVSELRRQVVNQDQDLWRLKQDLAAAQKLGAKAAQKREQAVARRQERPEWQGAVPGRPLSSTSSSARNTAGGDAAGGGILGSRDIGNTLASSASTSALFGQKGTGAGPAKGTVGPANRRHSFCGAGPGTAGGVENCGPAAANSGGGTSAANARQQQGGSRGSALGGQALQAVQAAAEQLETLRTNALQQALAARQQRLAQHAR